MSTKEAPRQRGNADRAVTEKAAFGRATVFHLHYTTAAVSRQWIGGG